MEGGMAMSIHACICMKKRQVGRLVTHPLGISSRLGSLLPLQTSDLGEGKKCSGRCVVVVVVSRWCGVRVCGSARCAGAEKRAPVW